MRIVLVISCLLALAPVTRVDARQRGEEPSDNGERPAARGDALLRSEMLRHHNLVRRAYGMTSVSWDDGLAGDAAAYAHRLAATHRFEHAPRRAGAPLQGENLWMGTRDAYAYAEMVNDWSGEESMFRPGRFPDVSRTGSWHDISHFTQMIWPRTTMVGCGFASNQDNDYLVCRYAPAGNVYGEMVAAR